VSDTHISLDVLYCLPIIQAARAKSLQSKRFFDSYLPVLIGTFVAVVWSLAERQVQPEEFTLGVLVLNIFTRSLVFSILGRVLARLWKEREYGKKDFLTNLTNRAQFLEQFSQEQLRSERSRRPYSLLFIDIDRFKILNDEGGHQVGDTALHKIAETLRANSRKTDTVARIGGDEFALLFPETNTRGGEL
jgi:GGDEF domain-containing protein